MIPCNLIPQLKEHVFSLAASYRHLEEHLTNGEDSEGIIEWDRLHAESAARMAEATLREVTRLLADLPRLRLAASGFLEEDQREFAKREASIKAQGAFERPEPRCPAE